MRVLLLTGEYPPMQGGVGDYTWALGSALATQDVDVHVLTSQMAGPAHLIPAGVANVYADVVSWGWKLSTEVRRLAREVEPDVLHIQYQSAAYGLHPAINLLPRMIGKRPRRLKVVFTFHDLRVPYLLPKAGSLRWLANLEPAHQSDAIIVTNAEDHDRLQRYDKLRDRLTEVPIGSNISPEPPSDFSRSDQRARWGVGPSDLLLSYFGFLNASKGGEELVESLAGLHHRGIAAHLLMVGGQIGASDPTNLAYLESVRRLVAAHDLSDHVHWTGFTAASQVSANLLASDVAVLPYRDGASFRRGSLMAALAHGLAIVSTQPVVSVPQMQHGQNIWLVPPNSPEHLADAIERLWANSALRGRLGQGATELADHFTWDAIARRHVEVYRALGA